MKLFFWLILISSNGHKTMEDNFDDFLDQVDPINDIQVNTPI